VVYRLDRISRNISDFSSLIEELGRQGIKTKTGVLSPGFPSSLFCRILST
jgi:DNA invertase Pin-like site-specific DNA recombinase